MLLFFPNEQRTGRSKCPSRREDPLGYFGTRQGTVETSTIGKWMANANLKSGMCSYRFENSRDLLLLTHASHQNTVLYSASMEFVRHSAENENRRTHTNAAARVVDPHVDFFVAKMAICHFSPIKIAYFDLQEVVPNGTILG